MKGAILGEDRILIHHFAFAVIPCVRLREESLILREGRQFSVCGGGHLLRRDPIRSVIESNSETRAGIIELGFGTRTVEENAHQAIAGKLSTICCIKRETGEGGGVHTDAFGYGNAGYAFTSAERRSFDCGNTFGNVHNLEFGTILEYVLTDGIQGFWKFRYFHEIETPPKCIITEFGKSCRKCDGGQLGAELKCICADVCHAFGYFNFSHCICIGECFLTDLFDIVRDVWGVIRLALGIEDQFGMVSSVQDSSLI